MDHETLRQLTELKYQKSLSGLSDILAREAALRKDLQQLRDQALQAQSLPVAAHSMRNIGADVIWLRWVAKTSRALNIELAQVLAQKEALMAEQKRALGRKTVAEDLSRQAQAATQSERAKAALSEAVGFDVMRRQTRQ